MVCVDGRMLCGEIKGLEREGIYTNVANLQRRLSEAERGRVTERGVFRVAVSFGQEREKVSSVPR